MNCFWSLLEELVERLKTLCALVPEWAQLRDYRTMATRGAAFNAGAPAAVLMTPASHPEMYLVLQYANTSLASVRAKITSSQQQQRQRQQQQLEEDDDDDAQKKPPVAANASNNVNNDGGRPKWA